jgi:hypothetical protein
VLGQQPIDQSRARLSHFAVNQHRASAADFLQAVAVPGDRRDVLTIDRGRLGRDSLQHADDVHLGLVRDLVPLPIAGLTGAVLAQDADLERRRMSRMAVAVSAMTIVRMCVVHARLLTFDFRRWT